MKHARKFDGIQAGHALNAGKVLRQYCAYAKTLPPEYRYEGTLTISVLQALLTQCCELLKYMEDDRVQGKFFDQVISDGPYPWGLSTSFVTKDTFPGDLTLARLLEHLRNAVSHPSPDLEFRFQPTGYTTTDDPSEHITGYRFTDSPWVKSDRREYKGRQLPVSRPKDAQGLVRQFHRAPLVDDYLEVLPQSDGTFEVGRHGAVYWPVFVIELPLVPFSALLG